MARITKSAEDRKREIIEAAKEMFLAKGFDKTQVLDISKQLNVAQGLVYHYFKSKTEILYAVMDALAEEHVEELKRALAESKGSAMDCLGMLFKHKPEMQCHKELFSSIMSDQGMIEYCHKKMTVAMSPLLLMLIERGNRDGSWNCEFPPETAAFIVQGISGIFGLLPPEQNEQRKKDAFADIIFRLLGVRDHPQ